MSHIRVATMADIDEINSIMQRDFGGADMSEWVSNPLNVCLLSDGSMSVFAWRGPSVREVHVSFAARGRAALSLGREMLDLMRRTYGPAYFWSLIPIESRKVITFTRMMGWKSKGSHLTPQGMCELFVSEDIPCPL